MLHDTIPNFFTPNDLFKCAGPSAHRSGVPIHRLISVGPRPPEEEILLRITPGALDNPFRSSLQATGRSDPDQLDLAGLLGILLPSWSYTLTDVALDALVDGWVHQESDAESFREMVEERLKERLGGKGAA